MEAAFKQMMQQHTGNNEFVTLTMSDGKSLEFIADPSQAEALMQVAAQSQSVTDAQLQDVQDIIKQEATRLEAGGSGIEATGVSATEGPSQTETASKVESEAASTQGETEIATSVSCAN